MVSQSLKRPIKTTRCRLDVALRVAASARLGKIRRVLSQALNLTRRNLNYFRISWSFRLGRESRDSVRLHLGCGEQRFAGYVNIDMRRTRATNLVCDIRRLPYPTGSVTLIETYHVIEHLPRHDLPTALAEWQRILTPDGKLIIECPDFDEAVKDYMAGKEERLDSIFGLQRFPGDTHLFGYNFARLKKLLEYAGFVEIQRKEPQDYHARHEPCLRVECRKNESQ